MKPGIATSLSIAGVLVAGGAALALNSTVLQASSTVRGTPALAAIAPANADSDVVTPIGQVSASAVAGALTAKSSPAAKKSSTDSSDTTTPVTSPSTTAPSSSTKLEPPTTSPTISVPPMPRPTPPAREPVDKVFQVEDFASITVTASGRTLSVKSVVFSPGAQYTVTNGTSPDYTSTTQDHVRVVMASPNRTVVFSARLMNGQVVAAISDPSSGNLPPRRDRDEDRGEDRDESHEDQEREDREDREDREHAEDHEERENDDD